MKIFKCNNVYPLKFSLFRSEPSFSSILKPKLFRDIFCKQKKEVSGGIGEIKNIFPGEFGTQCKASIPLANFEEQFCKEDLAKLYKKGLSTNTEAWADCFLKSSADKPLSTSSVYDCSVLYLFNESTGTHFLYHSYFDVYKNFFQSLIKTLMPEGYTKAAIVPGVAEFFHSHKQTISEMFKALKESNRKGLINVYHYSSELPEIVCHNGCAYEIPNRRISIGLSDKGQASFRICDLKLNSLFKEINYNASTSKKIGIIKNLFEQENYDIEIMKIINKLLFDRLNKIKKIENCKTLEELNSLIESNEYSERLKYFNAFEIKKHKILSMPDNSIK